MITFVVIQFFSDLKVAVLIVLFEAWETEANWIICSGLGILPTYPACF